MSKKAFTPTDLDRQKPDDGGPATLMTIRDHFAGQAINQALALEVEKRLSMVNPPPFDTTNVALACYQLADAMIRERAK